MLLSLGIVDPSTFEKPTSPLLKSGKPSNELDSYRPIALTSCFGKVFERLICNRIKDFLQNNIIIASTILGLRPNRSCLDTVTSLILSKEDAFKRKKDIFAIFYDLKDAFGTVKHGNLKTKMANAGLNRKLINICMDYINNRQLAVKLNETISHYISINTGLPQGSTLSPILFLFMLNDLPNFR